MREPATLTLLVEFVFLTVIPRMTMSDPARISISHRGLAISSGRLAAGLPATLESIVISEIRHLVQSPPNSTDVYGADPLFTCSVALPSRRAPPGSERNLL